MKRFFNQVILTYLRILARISLNLNKPTVIGIAGSVGKTSTRNAVEAVLKEHFVVKAVGNSETGIPLGILGLVPKNYSALDWLAMCVIAPFRLNYLRNTKYLIAEMGIDEPDPPKNMEYLLTILKPSIAVSLNVSATHSQQFDHTVPETITDEKKRLESVIHNIAREDTKIITQSHCSSAIYNANDPYINELIEKAEIPAQKLTFGNADASDISYGKYTVGLKGCTFTFFVRDNTKRHELPVTFTKFILPQEYQEVLAAAILVCLQTGLTLEQIKSSLEKQYELPKGRASIFKGINNSMIIDSTYNASKTSNFAFLNLINMLKKDTNKPTVFLFGDMRELGRESEIEHSAVAEKLVGTVDYLYLVGPQTREFVLPTVQKSEKYFKEIRWFDTAARAGEYLKDHLQKNSILLAKGSQNTIFLEEAVKAVLSEKSDKAKLCRQSDYWLKIKYTN